MRTKLYVGHVKGTMQGDVFRSETTPTRETHGQKYLAVVGPFRTRRAADWLADPVKGRFNPHCRCVADAERLAKKYS